MSAAGSAGPRLRAAVIGLGAMGRHHVRVLGEIADVDLIAVADINGDTVARFTERRLIRGYTDAVELLDREQPDIVSVAVPTGQHLPVTLLAIERGIHVLVEKPIAATIAEAVTMIESAERAGVRLMVGHVERFNPAIIELKRRLPQAGQIFQLLARRVGPFPDRIRDVGVVVDLASHDIDAMRFLLGRPVESLYAQTAQRIHTDHEDMLFGTVRFAGGIIAGLDVNWLTPTKIRELTIVGSHGTFIANYLSQDLIFLENAAVPSEWEDFASLQDIRGVSEGNTIRYAFRKQEPLRAELEAFVEYVRNGGPCPAPPEDAVEALRVALGLIQSAHTGAPIVSEFPQTAQT